MKMDLFRLMNRWNCRLIDGNPFVMVTPFNPLPRVYLTGGYKCVYIIQIPLLFLNMTKRGYGG